MTGEQVIEKLREHAANDLLKDKWDTYGLIGEYFDGNDDGDIPEVGKFKVVDQYGCEGRGDDYWIVVKFLDHDVLIRIDGFYSSYHGTDWDNDNIKVVQAKEKTITVYE